MKAPMKEEPADDRALRTHRVCRRRDDGGTHFGPPTSKAAAEAYVEWAKNACPSVEYWIEAVK